VTAGNTLYQGPVVSALQGVLPGRRVARIRAARECHEDKEARRMRSRLLQVLFVITLVSATSATGDDWDDFSFDLPGGYFVLRASPSDTHIWRKWVGTTPRSVTGQSELGPVCELAFDEHFIFVKNRAFHRDGDISGAPTLWTIIDYSQQVVYGPFAQADFQNKSAELGISPAVQWTSLDDARTEAIQDGRAVKKQSDVELIRGIMYLGVGCLLLIPALLVVSLLMTFVLRRVKMFIRMSKRLE